MYDVGRRPGDGGPRGGQLQAAARRRVQTRRGRLVVRRREGGWRYGGRYGGRRDGDRRRRKGRRREPRGRKGAALARCRRAETAATASGGSFGSGSGIGSVGFGAVSSVGGASSSSVKDLGVIGGGVKAAGSHFNQCLPAAPSRPRPLRFCVLVLLRRQAVPFGGVDGRREGAYCRRGQYQRKSNDNINGGGGAAAVASPAAAVAATPIDLRRG